jgi:hypothetical protein
VKVGDLVRFSGGGRTGGSARGCLPSVEDSRWADCGLVEDLRVFEADGNVSILWPGRGQELVAAYFLEVVNEGR